MNSSIFNRKYPSLTSKLIALFLLITIIPLIITSWLSYQTMSKTLQQEYLDSNLRLVQQGGNNIANYLERLNQLTLSPYIDNEFMYTLLGPTEFIKSSYNEKFLKNILFSRDDLLYLYFYIPASKSLYSFSKELSAKHTNRQFSREDWVQKTMNSPDGFYLAPTHPFKNYRKIGSANSRDLVFSMNRNIKDIATNKILGILSISTDIRPLAQMCNSLVTDGEIIILMDKDYNLLYANRQYKEYQNLIIPKQIKNNQNGNYIANNNHRKYLVVFSRSFHRSLLIKAIPFQQFITAAQKTVTANIVFGLGIMLILIFAAITISYKITYPIKQLVRKMNELSEGKFNIAIEKHTNDEVGLLTRKFNEMAQKIKELINSEYKAQLTAKDAQLQGLQAQINPHFLNNALQSLGTLALRKRAPEIYSMALAIASILRYSLKPINDLVPLRVELENTRHYLSIQQIRFGERLECQLTVEEEALDFQVPRLILQPLVENSIKYGIDTLNKTERIQIGGRLENGCLALAISDTGQGMTEERLDEIRKWFETDEPDYGGDGEHLGLKNVWRRIQLIYNGRALMEIQSEYGLGTRIILRLPRKE